MFGAFRCSRDEQNTLEFVDLSGNSSVDARNYTVVACDQCRSRKVKCSGDRYGCQRCQATLTTCTYRSSIKATDQPSSQRRQSTSAPNSSSKPPAKRQQTRRNTDSRSATGDALSRPVDTNQQLPPADTKDGLWTPITSSGPVLHEFLHDWDDFHSKDSQSLDLLQGESINAIPMESTLPDSHDTSSYSPSTTASIIDDDSPSSLVIHPPTTVTSVDSHTSRSRGCGCIRSLADILERVSGDDGSNLDEVDHFDDLLVYLRDGVETCKQVLPCKLCCVCTTNPMFVVTIFQQLATFAQSLCCQLVMYQHKGKTTSIHDVSPLSDIYVGKYHVRAAALHLRLLFPIVSMHIRDLKQILELLQNDIIKGTKAYKSLRAAADVVQTAYSDLQLLVPNVPARRQKMDGR
ncbi:hypothetical protein BDV27DRAFT_91947 [Aspergillus caelatus]|uniref:Zn(2)-C6 fungal-type domain-containing protein n=1 Tax=Aspergillus caelatus TaxID=61420 RepID=A0A5N7A975_9EURO|nr:uncharacterized protein BDV27DRAFT_91947 [Aspergillus caelatus]KAE8366427.1 hypothetical protein BDV27DRAFT_91947 [Aspergillus caelatus]